MFTPKSRIGEILDNYPEAEKVLTDLGFTELLNPVMRKTVAKFATLEMAAAKKQMDVRALIAALKNSIAKEDS